MGSLLSSQRRKRERFEDDDDEIFQNGKRKRIRMSDGYNNIVMQLIPTLPDEISYQIIARVPRVWYKNLKAISRTWKAAITSTEIHRVRRELGTMEEWLYVLEKNVNDILTWHALDPISGVWQKLPPMPNVENKEESRVGLSRFFMWNMVGSDLLNFWFGRKGSSNQLPFCGCAVGAADGCLYVLGGFLRGSAMSCVWKYDPCSDAWYEVMAVSSSPTTATAMTIPNVSTTVSIPNPAHVISQARTSPQPRFLRRSPHAPTHIAASNVSMHNSNLVCLPNQARSTQHPNAFLKQNSQIPASTSPMTTRTIASPNVSCLSSMPNSNLLPSQPRNNIVSPSITTATSLLPVQVVNHCSEFFSNNPGRPNTLQVGTATASPAPHLRSFVRPVFSKTPTIPLLSEATQYIPPFTHNSSQNMLAQSSVDPLFSSANENKTNQIPGSSSVPAVELASHPTLPLNQSLVPMDSNNSQPSLPPNSSIGRQEPQHLDFNRVSEAEMMFKRGSFPAAAPADETTTAADKPVCLSSDEDT